MAKVSQKLRELRLDINKACSEAGRKDRNISIMAVTKYADCHKINEAIKAGITLIGENKVQDAKVKFPHILPVKKHFIGHLQTNKVRDAVSMFDCIEAVDSYRLAEIIDKEAEKIGKNMAVLIEVNVANDPAKHGIKCTELDELVRKMQDLRNISIKGLMTILPLTDDDAHVHDYFKKMKVLFDHLKIKYPSTDTLSMGMSNDFEYAVMEGATEIRIGSYLFK